MADEAGGVHPVADFTEVDATFAHEASVVEEIGGGRPPITDMKGMQTTGLAREINLRLQLRVPPDVVNINRDAHRLWRAKRLTNLMCLMHRVHRAAVIGIHRV